MSSLIRWSAHHQHDQVKTQRMPRGPKLPSTHLSKVTEINNCSFKSEDDSCYAEEGYFRPLECGFDSWILDLTWSALVPSVMPQFGFCGDCGAQTAIDWVATATATISWAFHPFVGVKVTGQHGYLLQPSMAIFVESFKRKPPFEQAMKMGPRSTSRGPWRLNVGVEIPLVTGLSLMDSA